MPVPKQCSTREENTTVKRGEVPQDREDKPTKLRQKDLDARWTKKHGKSYYGYKNHINIDNKHKLIQHNAVSDAAVHDSQMNDAIIDEVNTSAKVWADSTYRSRETEQWLKEGGFDSLIHHKGKRGVALSEHKKAVNKTRSSVRARVEHVFGFQKNSMGGKFILTIGLARARTKIRLMNITYNMMRYLQLEKYKEATMAWYWRPMGNSTKVERWWVDMNIKTLWKGEQKHHQITELILTLSDLLNFD